MLAIITFVIMVSLPVLKCYLLLLNYSAMQRRNMGKSSNQSPREQDKKTWQHLTPRRAENQHRGRLAGGLAAASSASWLPAAGSSSSQPDSSRIQEAGGAFLRTQSGSSHYPHLLSGAPTSKTCGLLPKTENGLMSPARKNNKQMH